EQRRALGGLEIGDAVEEIGDEAPAVGSHASDRFWEYRIRVESPSWLSGLEASRARLTVSPSRAAALRCAGRPRGRYSE
ncbi:hypothetical protein, partial [Rubrivirga sp.]|uniref:hypothetical protein n=1 Tax=Rubrivirga sp. TaxID=1885344 RepID=UPI003C782F60